MKRILLTLLIIGLAPPVLAQDPNAVIEEAVDLIAEQMSTRRDELAADNEALYAVIDEILLPRFDRRYAAQLVLGKHWRTASDEQKADFIDAYYRNLLQKYADGLLEFDEDRIKVLPYRGDDTKSRTMVKTEVTLEDGTRVPVNYGLVKRESGWMIFDVVVEGISYVRNFRAELNSEIQSTSLDAVIARLQSEAGESSES